MTDPSYRAEFARLGDAAESEFLIQMAARKSAVVALFPFLFRSLVSGFLWPCLLKLGGMVASVIVSVVLDRLGEMTLAQVVGLLREHRESRQA